METEAPAPRLSRLSLASLILGILAVTCLSFITGIPAIICGHLARYRIRHAGDRLRGSTQALVGLVLGYLSLVIALVLIPILTFLSTPTMQALEGVDQSERLLDAARRLHQGVQSASIDAFSGNQTRSGWPADAGITSRQQLATMLIAGHYLSDQDLEEIGIENFLVGNVAQSDAADTIFLISRPEASADGAILILKSGEGQIFESVEAAKEAGKLPPRTPEFLD